MERKKERRRVGGKKIGKKTWEKNVVFVGLRDEEEVYDRVNREASTEKV